MLVVNVSTGRNPVSYTHLDVYKRQALPPYRYKRKGYIPRITPSNNMGMSYNAGNEQYYYKTYRPAPDDNIMKNNSFNPYFVKSELLNF